MYAGWSVVVPASSSPGVGGSFFDVCWSLRIVYLRISICSLRLKSRRFKGIPVAGTVAFGPVLPVQGVSALLAPRKALNGSRSWRRQALAYAFGVNLAMLASAPQAFAQDQPASAAEDLPEERGCELVTKCPTNAGPDPSLQFPNSLFCGSYCRCDWGAAIYTDCPGGLHWNDELKVCDWPAGAQCTIEKK